MVLRALSTIGLSFITSTAFSPARSEVLIAQSKVNPRIPLAQDIQKVAFQFASNPEDYSLVEKTNQLSWKMIRMSEGLSSCSIPAYYLPQKMEGLNTSYVMMMNTLKQMGNVPESVKDQTRASYEGMLNGQKKSVAIVLDEVMKYCN